MDVSSNCYNSWLFILFYKIFYLELLGREVTDSKCVSGSKLSWNVSNKYYAAEVLLYVHQTVKEVLDSMRSYEAVVVLCNLSQVPQQYGMTWLLHSVYQ